MFDWFGLHIPDWVFLVAGVGAAAVAYRYLGLRAALAALAAVAVLLARTSGQKAGAEQRQKEARHAIDKVQKKATSARNTAIGRNASVDRLREDDGFKRD